MPETIPYTPRLPSAAEASGLGGTTHRGGGQFPAATMSETTPVRRYEFERQQQWLLLERLYIWAQSLIVEPIGGLNVGVSPGVYRRADGTDVTFAGSASYAIADDATDRKIWIDAGTNTLDQGDDWPVDKTTYMPLAELDTASGAVVSQSVRDRRTLVALAIPASATSINSTNDTTFTLDSDNAGAEVDQDVRFNRGSSHAEDAALRWVAASGIFRLLAAHSAGTRAALDAAGLKIGGADALDASGLLAAMLAASRLYTFGANGASAAGMALTPAGGAGAPGSGAHTTGELAVDSAGVLRICTSGGSPGTWARVGDQVETLPAGSVTTAALSDPVADKLPQVSIGDASGASPQTVTVQILDRQGNALSEVVYLEVGVYQDADGAAQATNATIAVGGTGSLVRSVVTNKLLRCKTDASGALELIVTDGTSETVYVLAATAPRSRALDCQDLGTVVIA